MLKWKFLDGTDKEAVNYCRQDVANDSFAARASAQTGRFTFWLSKRFTVAGAPVVAQGKE